LVEIVSGAAAAFPLAVLDRVEKALTVRDRYQAGGESPYTASGLPPGGSKPKWIDESISITPPTL